MDPPSVLSGAMSRERKPFTYTPGGIDLSEIKSERMAQRLMRNAMNPGVPVTPAPPVKSPPPITSSVVMPNYNCLPVQVFPTFTLPANPKALLRTRSNPDPNESLQHKIDKSSNFALKNKTAHSNITSKNTLPNKYDENNFTDLSSLNHYNSGYTVPILHKKEESTLEGTLKNKAEEEQSNSYEKTRPLYLKDSEEISNIEYDNNHEITNASDECDKIKSKKEEIKVEHKENGDTNAAITLKLPSKKSEVKTEKKVEIVKNTLPDGSRQEVKTTTTTTTIDGKTEITTETETTTFPKDCGDDDEYEVVEEEEEEELSEKEEVRENQSTSEIDESTSKKAELNGKVDGDEVNENEDEPSNKDSQLITHDERHESSTTKKVVIIQSEAQDSDDENEREHDDNEQDNIDVEEVVVLKATTNDVKSFDKPTEQGKTDESENEAIKNDAARKEAIDSVSNGQEEVEDDEEEFEEIEEEEEVVGNDTQDVNNKEDSSQLEGELELKNEEVEEEYEEAEEFEEKEQQDPEVKDDASKSSDVIQPEENLTDNQNISNDVCDVITIPVQVLTENVAEYEKEQKENEKPERQFLPSAVNVPLMEPTVPLDKVEEVEIKPIVPAKEVITKTHTEITSTTSDKPVGTHSTQTEYNVLQNIVTVNRTIRTLDHAYEEIPDNIPTIKTFVPPTLEGNFLSSQPAFKSYQAGFTPEPQTERRHSLLLERLSVERQMAPEIHQNNHQTSNQTYQETQYMQEPQSEILTVSNVKPSMISKSQQWYQRNETENHSTLQSTDALNNNQTQVQFKPQIQSFYQPKPQPQPQVQTPQIRVQSSPQPIYLPSSQMQTKSQSSYYSQEQSIPYYQSQPASQRPLKPQHPEQSTLQTIYHPQPQYQQSYIDNTSQDTYSSSTNKYEHSAYPSYTSKPLWTGKSVDSQTLSSTLSTQKSYLQKDSTESFEKAYQTQISSSYVPPPWEQDPNYAVNNSTSSLYQPTPSKTAFTTNLDWKPVKPSSKFSKSTPTSYIPPAPNQSFVKPVNTSEPVRQQGRKTYYSEYERRYISVPEATYIPNETKFQPQPDPSPQYFYDNNEPAEVVEPQWRKELREFKEQSSKTMVQTEHTTVRPPWEDDPKYATPKDFTPTPTWTQTLKPRSWRERSFEPEYIGSQEWPKTNTLGRGRPQSSYVKKTFDRMPDRTRGVSVDRYNPDNYQSPLTREHPPPSSHILDPIVQGKTYYNPSVPAYHSRASVEPREQPVTYQQPRHRESRAAPVQSRSFKYLQWITGTDD